MHYVQDFHYFIDAFHITVRNIYTIIKFEKAYTIKIGIHWNGFLSLIFALKRHLLCKTTVIWYHCYYIWSMLSLDIVTLIHYQPLLFSFAKIHIFGRFRLSDVPHTLPLFQWLRHKDLFILLWHIHDQRKQKHLLMNSMTFGSCHLIDCYEP